MQQRNSPMAGLPDPPADERHAPFGWTKIWDLPTRLFHWLLVIAVSASAYTGFFGAANQLDMHVWAGYGIGALVIARLIWGVFGTEYSRLDRLAGALPKLREHVRGLARLRPTHYAGHNPAGSLMIIGLFAVLLVMVGTGLVALGGQEKQGILAGITPFSIGLAVRQLHGWIAYLLVAMIFGHLIGVVAETLLLRISLVQGMLTGWLPSGGEGGVRLFRRARPMLALAACALAGLAVWGASRPLSALPALGVPAPVTNATYIKECGACHWTFHPSLLPRASWRAIMETLDKHFGEDASLTDASAAEIAAFLDANAAETADTEPANRFRQVSAQEPRKITETPFWQRLHRHFAPSVFKSPDIRSGSNCLACHKDAVTGRFDDQQISVPHAPQNGVNQ